ncbi:MAG: hypothetical protein K2J32_05935 [Ruminococcus sp.]|nr:hypothetical protein [Ruminococcus sp.]
MKKLEVNHTPDFIRDIAIALAILWIILIFIICSAIISKLIAMFLSITILLIIIGVGWYIDSRKTIVEYDTEKIKWKWLWLEYTANFSEIDSVYYTIVHERTRYGYNHRFEIVFYLKNSTELRLNDRLQSEDIDNCINGITDDIKLMQLYKFIENIYPEKCSGFVKDNDIY